eukprot:1159394-Pelagomonas_calceolata.AAC.17
MRLPKDNAISEIGSDHCILALLFRGSILKQNLALELLHHDLCITTLLLRECAAPTGKQWDSSTVNCQCNVEAPPFSC